MPHWRLALTEVVIFCTGALYPFIFSFLFLVPGSWRYLCLVLKWNQKGRKKIIPLKQLCKRSSKFQKPGGGGGAPLHQTANFRFRLQLFFVFRFWLFFSCPLLWIHIGWRLSGFQKKCLLFLDLFGNFLYFFCPFGGWKTNHSIKINQVWVLSSGHYLFETCQISASTAVLT